MNALIISGNSAIRAQVTAGLRQHDFAITDASAAEFLAPESAQASPGLLVVDWQLAPSSAQEVCRRGRVRYGTSCVILGVEVDESPEVLRQLQDAGVDDYVARPFSSPQAMFRLTAAARRCAAIAPSRRCDSAAAQEDERYRLLAEHSTDMISRHTLAGVYLYASPASYSLLGYLPEQLVGRDAYDFFHPDDLPIVRRTHDEILESSSVSTVTYRIRRLDGGHVWVETTCKTIRNADTRALEEIVCVTRDVTQRRRAEEALRASEAQLQSILDNTPSVVYIKDHAGRFVVLNNSFERLFSLSRDKCLGKTDFDVFPRETAEQFQFNDRLVLAKKQPVVFEEQVVVGGVPRTYLSVKFPLLDAASPEGALCGISTDITERKQSEDLLKQLLEVHERERQLVAYDIHDGLAQYLTGALMHLEAYVEKQHGNEELARQDFARGIELLRDGVYEARRLIGGLRPPVLDELGIIAAISYLLSEMRASVSDVEFVHEEHFERLAPPLETAVFRIVQEALNNVRQHSTADKVLVELLHSDDHLHIAVRDWGIGFNLQDVQNDRFGLRGIRERARLLGGNAAIQSSPGSGTRVTVDFPILAAS